MGYENVLRHVYSPEYVCRRAIKFLQESGDDTSRQSIAGKIRLRDIGTFFRIVFHVGLIGRERKYLWKLLVWTLINRRQDIDLAFLFAVLTHQLRKMYDRYLASVHNNGHRPLEAFEQTQKTLAAMKV